MSELKYTVKEIQSESAIAEYVRDCVDVPKFLAFCEVCPNYGATWSCPPFDFDPTEVWRRYDRIRFYARMLVPDFPEQDAQAALDALKTEKENYLELLLQWERATPGSLALAAGSCTACSACARGDKRPCRFPGKMRHSIESLGGDVGKTAEKYLGQPLLWIRDGKPPAHLMLVGALLLPGKAGCSLA